MMQWELLYPLQETAISGNRLQTLEAVYVTQAVETCCSVL